MSEDQNPNDPTDPNAEPAEREYDKQPGGNEYGEDKDFDPTDEPDEQTGDMASDPKS